MNAFIITTFVVGCVYTLVNLRHDIHMLQQNSYRLERYWKYLKKGDMSNSSRLIDLALFFLLFASFSDIRLSFPVIASVWIVKTVIALRKKFKKPLVYTDRVKRIYTVDAFLTVGGFIVAAVSLGTKTDVLFAYSGLQLTMGILILINILSWIPAMLSILLLAPVEKAINRKYWNQASSILKSMHNLKVIGITGSYGKTSTKHFLERILSEDFEVIMTPGSFNTPMGVIRTVREMMKPYHQIFICEMGAKQKGDIKEICDLVNPEIGIITAVGPMHLETFKTMDNVQSTKFELEEALPENGLAVINNDFEYCASHPRIRNNEARYTISANPNSGFKATDILYTPEGTYFKFIDVKGNEMPFHTKLVGGGNISNLMAAIIVALHLGMSYEKIKRAVAAIEQVEHRLSMKKSPGGITIIDDAFNSNPTGSKMALEVLGRMKSGKRVVVTPGMIELGARQYELNKELGKDIASNADIAVIVGQYNREAIVDGLNQNKFREDNLYIVETFNDSQKLLSGILAKGDTVLYENDLPDSFK